MSTEAHDVGDNDDHDDNEGDDAVDDDGDDDCDVDCGRTPPTCACISSLRAELDEAVNVAPKMERCTETGNDADDDDYDDGAW